MNTDEKFNFLMQLIKIEQELIKEMEEKTMIKVEVKKIKWDLDLEDKKELNLPTEYTFEIEDKSLLDDYDFVPDVLSDRFGFCVDSCTYNLLD